MYQNSHQNNKFERTAASHFNRYSEIDLRTSKFDKLFITQNTFLSRNKYSSVKTKLPIISSYSSTRVANANLNSHGKINRLLESTVQISDELTLLNDKLSELKQNMVNQRESIINRAEQTKQGLGIKVGRLGQMINFSIAEAHFRTGNLIEHCEKEKKNNLILSEQIQLVKEKVRIIQIKMGAYTGEDKYYA